MALELTEPQWEDAFRLGGFPASRTSYFRVFALFRFNSGKAKDKWWQREDSRMFGETKYQLCFTSLLLGPCLWRLAAVRSSGVPDRSK